MASAEVERWLSGWPLGNGAHQSGAGIADSPCEMGQSFPMMERTTPVGRTRLTTATLLRDKWTPGSKPDGGVVNSLTQRKPNQAVVKAAQSITLCGSAADREEQSNNIMSRVTGRPGGLGGLRAA